MTKAGQRAYKRALSEIRGTEWWDILFPIRDIDTERMLKTFRRKCDEVSGDDGAA